MKRKVTGKLKEIASPASRDRNDGALKVAYRYDIEHGVPNAILL